MRELYAARAVRAYAAMQRYFHTRRGRYRRDGRVHMPGSAAHLWPFTRALVATLDLAGIGEALAGGLDIQSEIVDRLRALERYWDPDRQPPAYSSKHRRRHLSGDRYYDDNAWVGLALVQHERMRRGSGCLPRAEELFRFALDGWGWDQTPRPGGVFWVEQGRGTGRRNHDRNTVSTAPNAELGLHIAELKGGPVEAAGLGVREMYDWVLETLDASHGTNAPGTGLFWDKLRGDGTIDRTVWTYNQGSMVGANVLLARQAGPDLARHLARAEAIALKALRHFAGAYSRQPPGFNAIFFRNLLLLHHATADAHLCDAIINALREYVDWAWSDCRDRRDRFHFPPDGLTLLGQSAMVQLLALLAWDPQTYGRLA